MPYLSFDIKTENCFTISGKILIGVGVILACGGVVIELSVSTGGTVVLTVYKGNNDTLKEGHDQNNTAGRVVVKQLEHVHTALKQEWYNGYNTGT